MNPKSQLATEIAPEPNKNGIANGAVPKPARRDRSDLATANEDRKQEDGPKGAGAPKLAGDPHRVGDRKPDPAEDRDAARKCSAAAIVGRSQVEARDQNMARLRIVPKVLARTILKAPAHTIPKAQALADRKPSVSGWNGNAWSESGSTKSANNLLVIARNSLGNGPSLNGRSTSGKLENMKPDLASRRSVSSTSTSLPNT